MIRYEQINPTPATIIVACPSAAKTIVDRLADAICEIAGEQRPVTTQALLEYGFRGPVIKRYADQARGVARRRFNKHI